MEKKSDLPISTLKAKIFLFTILIANFFRNLGSSIVDIGLPRFILSLSGTLISYGLVVGIFSITQSIFQFPIASASDKFGRKLMIGIGMSIYIAGTFLCFMAQNVIQLILFRAIQGAGAYSSILQALTCEHFDKEKQGKAMAFYSFSLSLGYFGGIILGGYVAYYFNFRLIFLFSGTLTFISMILIFAFLDIPKKESSSSMEEILGDQNAIAFFSNIKVLIKERQYLLTIILNSLRWMFLNGSIVYIIWVLQIYWGRNELETSYLLIFIVFIYIISIILGGPLVDKFNSKRILIVGQGLILIAGGLFFLMSFIPNFLIFYMGCIISGMGFAYFQTAGNSQISNIIEKINPDLKGSGFGFNNTIGFICGALGPIIISSLGEFSLHVPFYFISILTCIALIITIKFIKV